MGYAGTEPTAGGPSLTFGMPPGELGPLGALGVVPGLFGPTPGVAGIAGNGFVGWPCGWDGDHMGGTGAGLPVG